MSGNFSGLGGPPVNYATRNCLLRSDQTPPSIFTKMFRQASWSWSGPPYFDPLVESSSHSQNAGLLSTEKAAMLTQYTAVLAFLVALFASVVKCQIGLRS